MSRKGMNSLQTECASGMIEAARKDAEDLLAGIDVRFKVTVGKEGNLNLEADVRDAGREAEEDILFGLGMLGASSAVICGGEPVDPRELL